MTETAQNGLIGSGIFIFLIGIAVLCLWGCPQYNVYTQRKEGEAQLAKAQYNRQVAVAEARAKMEASQLLSEADSLRAIGVAASNKIIAGSITQSYLQWLWIQNLEKADKSVIYVPSANGVPIMPIQEATRLQNSAPIIPTP